MISVVILINGHPIMARSAVNRLAESGHYVADDGRLIEHDPKDGAAALAIKMLADMTDTDAAIRKAYTNDVTAYPSAD